MCVCVYVCMYVCMYVLVVDQSEITPLRSPGEAFDDRGVVSADIYCSQLGVEKSRLFNIGIYAAENRSLQQLLRCQYLYFYTSKQALFVPVKQVSTLILIVSLVATSHMQPNHPPACVCGLKYEALASYSIRP